MCVRAVAVFHRGDVDAHAHAGLGGLGAHTKGKLGALLGAWRVQEWQGMDKFLEELSFPKWKRALAARAGQQYVLQLKGGSANGSLDDATIQIVTSDIRGKSSLELPLSGRGVVAHDGDNGAEVERSARPLDDRTVEITESYRGESRPYSVCKRTLTVSAIATTAPCPPLHPPRHPPPQHPLPLTSSSRLATSLVRRTAACCSRCASVHPTVGWPPCEPSHHASPTRQRTTLSDRELRTAYGCEAALAVRRRWL